MTTAPAVTFVYDSDINYGTSAPGRVLRVNVGSDYQERYTFDSHLRVLSTIQTIGSRTYTTSFNTYNEASQLKQMTYPSTRQLNFSFDTVGRLNEITGYVSNIGYNIAAQTTGDTLGNGVTEQFGYDANRMQLTSQKAGNASPYTNRMDLTYGNDASAGQMGSGSTAGNAGQLLSISGTINGTAESAAYAYDNLGRLVTSNQTSNGSSSQRRFGFDRWGNRTGVWDAVSGGNQIQSITVEQSGGAPTNRIQTLYGPRVNFALSSNGSTASASSNFSSAYVPSAAINGDRKGTGWGEVGGGWMDNTSNTYPDWIQVTFNGTKAIDEIDVFTLQDNYANPSEPTESMTFSQYGIKDFQIQYWNGLAWQTVSGGSITNNDKVWKKVTFPQITTTKIRVNVTNALNNYSRVTELEAWGPGAGTSYTYDAVGNLTNDGLHTYTYDSEDRIVSVDSGATATYAYDHQNRRYKKTIGSTVTHYVWQGGKVIAEHDGSTGAVLIDYVFSGRRMISRVAGGTRQYYLSDRLSTRMVLDTSGNVIGRQGQLPFGEDFGGSGTQEKHHFTNYDRDSESTTDYAVNRQYSQNIGRFNRPDPLSSSGKRELPQTWNKYSYVASDAINMTDPLGLFFGTGEDIDPCGFGGGAAQFTVDGMLFDPNLMCIELAAPESTINPNPIEPAPSCTINVEGRKGDKITQFTPDVTLTFPGGQNIMGPASYGVGGMSGWFWNTYIYAIIHDHSGLVGNWSARQEVTVMTIGTWWIPGNPDSVVVDPSPPSQFVDADRESPFEQYQYHSSDILAWVDGPGPRITSERRPYDLSKTFVFTSWFELGGRKMCSASWQLRLRWSKGELIEWEFQRF